MTSTIACPPRPLTDPTLPVAKLGNRDLFPDLEAKAYLAHAAISPLNVAGKRCLARYADDAGRFGAAAFLPWAEQRARLRDKLSELLGVSSADVALTAGTSYGIRDLALGLALHQGDEIVTFAGEFPANIVPFLASATRAKASVHFLPQPDPRSRYVTDQIVGGLEQRLRRGARNITLSAVQFQTGLRMPLEAISDLAVRFGARLLVDAIQCAGVMPLHDVARNFDALTLGAHKWLLGIEGAGALYVKRDFYRELQPLTLGWESFVGGERFLFEGKNLLEYQAQAKPTAEAFESSTPNVAGHAALEAGLEICMALGPAEIFAHVQRYHDALEPGLRELGLISLRPVDPTLRSTLLCFDLPDAVPVGALVRLLRAKGVVCSSPDGYLRFAPHFANSLEEVPVVVEAVQASLSALR